MHSVDRYLAITLLVKQHCHSRVARPSACPEIPPNRASSLLTHSLSLWSLAAYESGNQCHCKVASVVGSFSTPIAFLAAATIRSELSGECGSFHSATKY